MKRVLLSLFLAFLFFFVGANNAAAIGYTHLNPQGFVNDYAGLLTTSDKATIETQLVKLEKVTTAEIAVVTVNNMNGTYIEDYAVRLFEDWKIGKAAPKNPYDNGLLLLITMAEKKIKIETGYYTEIYMTAGQAGRLLDQSVLPYFNTGDYANGIKSGVNAIDRCIRDAYVKNGICNTIP